MGWIVLLVLAAALEVEARLITQAGLDAAPRHKGLLRACAGLLVSFVVIFGGWNRAAGRSEELLLAVILFVLPVVGLMRRRVWRRQTIEAVREKDANAAWIVYSTNILLYWIIGMGIVLVGEHAAGAVWTPLRQPLLQLLVQAVLGWVWAYRLCRRYAACLVSDSDTEVFARRPPSSRGAVLSGMIWGAAASAAAAWLVAVRPAGPSTPMQNMIQTNESGVVLFLFILAAVGVAPFFEEWIFRGYLYAFMRRMWGPWRAVTAVSLIFAALHVPQYAGDPLAVVVVAVFGFGLTWMRHRFGSVRPSIGGHVIFNFGMVVLPVIFFILRYPDYASFKKEEPRLSLEERQRRLEHIVSRHEDLLVAIHDLAATSLQLGDWEEAMRWTQEGLRRQPRSAAFRLLWGEILAAKGCFAQAAAVYNSLSQEGVLPVDGQKKLKKWTAEGEAASPLESPSDACDHMFSLTNGRSE